MADAQMHSTTRRAEKFDAGCDDREEGYYC